MAIYLFHFVEKESKWMAHCFRLIHIVETKHTGIDPICLRVLSTKQCQFLVIYQIKKNENE